MNHHLNISHSDTLADEETLQMFVKANNLFAPAIYKEVFKDTLGETTVSKDSSSLCSCSVCGKDETIREIRTALSLPDDKNQIEDGVRSLLSKLKAGDNYTLHSAQNFSNSISH